MTVIKFCIIVLLINICFLFTPMLIGYLVDDIDLDILEEIKS